VYRLDRPLLKPITSSRQLDASDVCRRQPITPIAKRGDRSSRIRHQDQADRRPGIRSRCKDPVCVQRRFAPAAGC
jgi:hypothetical protein